MYFSLLEEFLGTLAPIPTPPLPKVSLYTLLPYPDANLVPWVQEPLPYRFQGHEAPSEVVRRLLLAYEKAYERIYEQEAPPLSAKPERYKGFEKLYEMGLWLHAEGIAPCYWALGSFLRFLDAKRKLTAAGKDIGAPRVTWVFSIETTKDEKRLGWALECAKRFPGRKVFQSPTHKQLVLEYQRLSDLLLTTSDVDITTEIKRVFPNYEERVRSAKAHNAFLTRVWEGAEREGKRLDPSKW